MLLHGNNLDVTLTHYRRCTSNTHEVGSTGNPFTPKLPLSTRTTTLTGQTGRRTVGQRYEGVTQIKATLLRTHLSYVTAATRGRVALSAAYPYRAVTGGKTTKTECEIEHGGVNDGAQVMWLPLWWSCLLKIHRGGPDALQNMHPLLCSVFTVSIGVRSKFYR